MNPKKSLEEIIRIELPKKIKSCTTISLQMNIWHLLWELTITNLFKKRALQNYSYSLGIQECISSRTCLAIVLFVNYTGVRFLLAPVLNITKCLQYCCLILDPSEIQCQPVSFHLLSFTLQNLTVF